MIYLLTAIWLTPGSSSTAHSYTQTMHRTTQLTQIIQRTIQLNPYFPLPTFILTALNPSLLTFVLLSFLYSAFPFSNFTWPSFISTPPPPPWQLSWFFSAPLVKLWYSTSNRVTISSCFFYFQLIFHRSFYHPKQLWFSSLSVHLTKFPATARYAQSGPASSKVRFLPLVSSKTHSATWANSSAGGFALPSFSHIGSAPLISPHSRNMLHPDTREHRFVTAKGKIRF